MARPRALIPAGSWPGLMKADLAAAYLDCSTTTVRAMAARGEIPAARPDGKWDRIEIDKVIDGREPPPRDRGLSEQEVLERLRYGKNQAALRS